MISKLTVAFKIKQNTGKHENKWKERSSSLTERLAWTLLLAGEVKMEKSKLCLMSVR
jgi:hypothetical protein